MPERKGRYDDDMQPAGHPAERRNKMGAVAVVVLLVALLSLLMLTTGCSLNQQYVETTKGTHDIVFPDHRRYVATDPALTDDQKARRMRLMESQEELDRAALGK